MKTAIYKKLSPALFMIDPEKAHGMTLAALKKGLVPACKAKEYPRLRVKLWDRMFPNPVGMAAGFDKQAEVIAPLLKQGFGFVEVGTVCPRPQEGNPKPRIFREPAHDAIINRMGFPSGGVMDFKQNYEMFLAAKPRPNGVVGLNIGMNKTQKEPAKDYRLLVKMLGPIADYITVNISSPNTPGLRNLQERGAFLDLIGAIMDERKKACGEHVPPLLVKLAPDLDDKQQEELAAAALESGIDGFILTNTTLDRPDYLSEKFRAEKGGLSGAPVREKSTEVIRNFYRLTDGKMPIIGVGGIANGQHAYDKIKAGASLVQVYSCMVYEGPAIARNICAELDTLLEADGYENVLDAVGADHKK